jgi:hypothetical protein
MPQLRERSRSFDAYSNESGQVSPEENFLIEVVKCGSLALLGKIPKEF